MSQFAFCSNKDCNHSHSFGHTKSYSRNQRPNKPIPPQKYCTKCGSIMITECQTCSRERSSMDDTFCPDCGKPYK